MKDDIKEILDNPKILMLSYGNYISLDDYAKLKDYITNLQEENEHLRTQVNTYKNVIDKARHKLNIMFSNGNEDIILDDLLELDKILGEDNE